MIHREKSQKHPERMSGELANNQSTTGVSMLRAFLTSGIFACSTLPQTLIALVGGRGFVCNILINMAISLMCRCLLGTVQPSRLGLLKQLAALY
jgi:hypothetical protein